MQLKITTDYALRILLCLDAFPPKRTAEELSVQLGIAKSTVIKVMQPLRRKGWVASQEGVQGGYSLKTPLDGIALLDVFEAMEDTIKVNRCLEEDEYCSQFAARDCPVRNAYIAIQEAMEDSLSHLSLRHIASGNFQMSTRVIEAL